MYFVNNRKRNSDWVINEDDDDNDEEDDEFDDDDDVFREDNEFNLSLPNGKGFTVFDRSDMMVAVAIGNEQTPVDIGSSGKPLEFPGKPNPQRAEEEGEGSRSGENSNAETSRSIFPPIIDELYQAYEGTDNNENAENAESFDNGDNVENAEESDATDDTEDCDTSNSDNVEVSESDEDSDESLSDAPEVHEVNEVIEVIEVNEVNDITEYGDLNEIRDIDTMAEINAIANVAEYAEVEDTESKDPEVLEEPEEPECMVSDHEGPSCSQGNRNEEMNDIQVVEEEVECVERPSNPEPNPQPDLQPDPQSEVQGDAQPEAQANAQPEGQASAQSNTQANPAAKKPGGKEGGSGGVGLEFYKTKNRNSYVLHIPCLASFTFHGKLRFTLITGKIEVFGYVVDIESKNKTIEVYSPRRFMQIGIKSILPFSIPDYSNIEAALKNKAMLPESELGSVLSNFSPDDTLLLVEKLPSTLSPILDRYFDEIDIFFEKRVLQEGTRLERDLECLFSYKPKTYKIKTFTEGCEWKQIKVKKCNIVCGGKGVGKSTLVKFLINRSLATRDRVLCIDLDPGQSEFTPPGFVSAVLVRKPLLGPGFTHIIKPRKMAYIGALTAAIDPVKYMKSVNYILQCCKHDPYLGDIPWFVNTMGFNKDIGLDLMINIIKLFRPDVVIQINSSEKARNYMICLTANVVEIQPTINILPVEDEVLCHDLIKTESSSKMRELAIQSGFKAQQIRDLMTFAYFSPLVTFPYYSFNAIRPLWIKFENVYLAVNEPVPPRSILKIFNASLVGLCNLEGVSCANKYVIGNEDEVFCKVAVKPEIAPCLGVGIVRAIDVKERKIYVITHLPERDLVRVNCLNLGTITPPAAIFLKQTYVDHPTVYTDVYDLGNSQKLKRSYKYVPNRDNH